jgi:hypothetical protein
LPIRLLTLLAPLRAAFPVAVAALLLLLVV